MSVSRVGPSDSLEEMLESFFSDATPAAGAISSEPLAAAAAPAAERVQEAAAPALSGALGPVRNRRRGAASSDRLSQNVPGHISLPPAFQANLFRFFYPLETPFVANNGRLRGTLKNEVNDVSQIPLTMENRTIRKFDISKLSFSKEHKVRRGTLVLCRGPEGVDPFHRIIGEVIKVNEGMYQISPIKAVYRTEREAFPSPDERPPLVLAATDRQAFILDLIPLKVGQMDPWQRHCIVLSFRLGTHLIETLGFNLRSLIGGA